ncbi:MAG TPA: Hsp20/alpha crystallin family protein [Candidatus Baltobacteraceae bacterium]|nr:Hsp20/alpha crystallin family protein [Candidatus Baltobacteraceae bacterium]
MLERKDWTSDFNSLVDRAFADFPFLADFQFPRNASFAAPAMDCYEKDGKYVLDLAVPGYEAADVNVEVNGSTVTISGTHKDSEEKKAARYYRRELRTGSFTRTVTLPQDLDPEAVDATLNKGVLTVELKTAKPITPKKITVKA